MAKSTTVPRKFTTVCRDCLKALSPSNSSISCGQTRYLHPEETAPLWTFPDYIVQAVAEGDDALSAWGPLEASLLRKRCLKTIPSEPKKMPKSPTAQSAHHPSNDWAVDLTLDPCSQHSPTSSNHVHATAEPDHWWCPPCRPLAYGETEGSTLTSTRPMQEDRTGAAQSRDR